MFAVLKIATAALAVASTVYAAAIPRSTIAAPSTYDQKDLEPYLTYHTRYTALDCQDKHNTAFFDACCHPLRKSQSLSSRPKECDPKNNTPPHNPSTNGEGDDDNCNEEPSPSPVHTTPKVTVKPTTTTHTTPKATPNATTTHKTTSTKKTAASPTPHSTGEQNTGGFATFFYQNGVAGACGTVHSDSAFICAMDQARYGNSGNKSPLCGQQVQITNTKNGKTVTVTVADDCPTCTNANSIDLSKGAFEQIATLEEGEVPIVWEFV